MERMIPMQMPKLTQEIQLNAFGSLPVREFHMS
jgi:hypothetical protein